MCGVGMIIIFSAGSQANIKISLPTVCAVLEYYREEWVFIMPTNNKKTAYRKRSMSNKEGWLNI
jgi:hypothetical protein